MDCRDRQRDLAGNAEVLVRDNRATHATAILGYRRTRTLVPTVLLLTIES